MKKILLQTAVAALCAGAAVTSSAVAQTSDRYMGDIFLVGFNFCPQGSVHADGALYPVAQNQALFSLLGTIYGGDGRTTFAVPDMRGRVPVSYGQGTNLPPLAQGGRPGVETHTMTAATMPSHSHPVYGTSAEHSEETPQGNTLATFDDGQTPYSPSPLNEVMAPTVVTSTGGGLAFNNMAPSLVVRYCIVTQGMYPPRN
tara:strand:+ start:1295 stop:1894 length:600 start_codon:yes stop_codon:yes gene_type:complete